MFRPENKNQTNYFLVNDLEFPSRRPETHISEAYVVSPPAMNGSFFVRFLVLMLTL